jgi:feruloyl esterase
LIATKFTDDNPTKPVQRTMPLCPFPTQAHYAGTGNVSNSANWSCKANQELLQVGPNGLSAGLPPP